MAALLEVRGLRTGFDTDAGFVEVLDGVSFELAAGETLGLVGESGCGKSVSALSIMKLLPQPAGKITAGSIEFQNRDLVTLAKEEMHEVRGNRISMIFQEPMTALNPVHRVGNQIVEAVKLHEPDLTTRIARRRALEMLERVGIPAPDQRLQDYPHQLSGGMRQRVMIAMALAMHPDLLIADEPTTALDVTIQAQILDLLRDMQRESGMAILFITHDLGVIAELCDRVTVMYAGCVVEQAGVAELFSQPRHPYTQGLLRSIPRLDSSPKQPLATIPGVVPALIDMPDGCRFRNRCPNADNECERRSPELIQFAERHIACHHPVSEAVA
ncbi:MAG: ABC transporter ATP-binding protein [Pseudomonadales bacterium]